MGMVYIILISDHHKDPDRSFPHTISEKLKQSRVKGIVERIFSRLIEYNLLTHSRTMIYKSNYHHHRTTQLGKLKHI